MRFDKIKVLETGHNRGVWNMALDEALLKNAKNNIPTLRLYGWSKPCVSIGYFQGIDDIDYEYCMKNEIDVVRRITGGGAVFHDAELTYSFVTREFPENILESYREICQIIISGLAKMGLKAEFSPLNDVIMGGKKICGNAQTRKNRTLLQHGTILLEVDKQRMFSVLKIPIEKMQDKKAKAVSDRVTGINRSFEEVAGAIKESAKGIFGSELVQQEASDNEESLCEEIIRKRYGSKEWTFRR